VSHGGSAVGYVAQYMQFPDQRFSVVILSNLSNFSPGRIARNIADLYLADQFTESPTPRRRQRPRGEKPKPVKLTSSQLQTYIGNYYSDELDITYALDVESNNLVLKLRETSSILTAYSTDNFGWGRRRLEFKRGKDKRIIGFILQAGRVKNLKFQKIKE